MWDVCHQQWGVAGSGNYSQLGGLGLETITPKPYVRSYVGCLSSAVGSGWKWELKSAWRVRVGDHNP
jgi:hypothetical protein